ncbi:MAG: Rossmann-fold NAD(P)-binding domain-containing protein [Bacillota bacterium]
MRVCVIGLGQVGLPTFRALRRFYPETIGVDTNRRLVRRLAGAGLPVAVRAERPETVDAWVLAVPTGPESSALWQAVDSIAPRREAVIAIESTLPPGTMAQVKERFARRGLIAGRDIFLVHCPHRILLGVETDVFETHRVIGGVTPACLERGLKLYAPFAASLTAIADIRVVELSKVVESSLHYLEVAFAEDLKMYCDRVGVDFDDLRRTVNTKGNVNLMEPDYGIGGECLPKDLGFLGEVTRSPLLKAAAAVDEAYRDGLLRYLAGFEAVLVRGLTHKPGVPVTNYSGAVELFKKLVAAGVTVGVEDPILPPQDIRRLGLSEPGGLEYEAVVERGRVTIRRPSAVDA